MTLQKGVLVLFFLMDASSGKLIFPLPRWPPIVERAGYVRAAPVCTCARTRKSEARRTVVDQQGPLRGSRTDFIQHLSFFYSKMTMIVQSSLLDVPTCLPHLTLFILKRKKSPPFVCRMSVASVPYPTAGFHF